ncbi:hypothetical protein GCM10022254_72650 [Actinomadura meridiana]|uniref:ATP-grasp-modified RiPP n=1 Tax=Actinomadura meridiana TaxID=559626 RepID=A0ABP8CPP0_9ACTN
MNDHVDTAGVPWGWGRMTERLPIGPVPYTRVELDPITQTSRFCNDADQIVEMGKHGTNKTKGTATMSGGGDGDRPQQQTQDDNTTDYEQD